MLRFTIRRLLNMLFVLFAISVLVFLIFNKIPTGDPALRIAGRSAPPAVREQVREDFGFNDSLLTQYWRMMKKTVTGDLESYSNRVNVWEEVRRGIPRTTSLVVGAAIIWVGLGILFGTLSALYAGRWLDRFLTAFSIIGISLPVFWVG